MEKSSKKELLTIINQQNEKISRYETRLRDVVIAYKGLVTEKEALESSVKALSTSQSSTNNRPERHDTNDKNTEKTSKNPREVENQDLEETKESENQIKDEENDSVKQLHQQLTTLTNSLATLSAEKSRMEASFQADKKQLRLEKEERDKLIRDLQIKNQQAFSEIENLKLKLTNERQERDKEQNDHGVMIRELQKLLADERHQVEILEMRCEELKSKSTQMELQNSQNDRKMRDLKNELESSRRKLKRAELEIKSKEAPPLLFELQEEMANLKLHHQDAILQEQQRVAEAEERARKLAAAHEERVANLESRLAELSETVGTYDRLRQQDQAAITKLKEHIAQLDLENTCGTGQKVLNFGPEELKENKEVDVNADIPTLVEHIINLKTQLLQMNQQSEKPIDVKAIFNISADPDENLHKKCEEKILHLQNEIEYLRKQEPGVNEEDDTTSLVNALKERIQLLNAQMSDGEENKKLIDNLQKMLKAEKARSKSELTAVETDYRCRLALLEQQLQKQRERSLMLLEDKEQEIRILKSSFGMFLPGSKAGLSHAEQQQCLQETNTSDSMVKAHFGLYKNNGNSGESPHMLHYAHEIARRDVEISNLRKSNHRLESSLREMGRNLASREEAHQEKEEELKEEVARLERCQSREGANLEYLKNVVLSFLTSNDSNCKRHMLNAIAAVLKFSGSEFERVNRIHKTSVQASAR
ncbi:hypothetical protein R5R35_005112 [Gryllus longicercus]|uniref:GRIP domain-containing protein n=1 Tax=Gryllus longicercus TaxID=2509291 RepID=A0AAN9Z2G9_9ORTH